MFEKAKPAEGREIIAHLRYWLTSEKEEFIDFDCKYYQVFVDTGVKIPESILLSLNKELLDSKNLFRSWYLPMN